MVKGGQPCNVLTPLHCSPLFSGVVCCCLWFSYGSPMVFLLFSYCSPIILLLFSYIPPHSSTFLHNSSTFLDIPPFPTVLHTGKSPASNIMYEHKIQHSFTNRDSPSYHLEITRGICNEYQLPSFLDGHNPTLWPYGRSAPSRYVSVSVRLCPFLSVYVHSLTFLDVPWRSLTFLDVP